MSGSHKIVQDPEGYDDHWGYTNFEGKIVLDLGADYGSTVSWFFQKGAKKIIAVECDRERFRKLVDNFGNDPDVVCIKEKILSGDQINELIRKYKPDIAKFDIEGDEVNLLLADPDYIKLVKEYLIEYHGEKSLNEMMTVMEENGFHATRCWVNPWESGTCGVIYATR